MKAEPSAQPCEHLVQFYGGDEARLADDVAVYLCESLRQGGAAIVIAAESSRSVVSAAIGARIGGDAPREQRLVLLDVEETLATFMRDGRPDPVLFEKRIGERVRELAVVHGRVRAFGEMVGLLWERREYGSAIELERLWNALLQRLGFGLFCGYPIDVLGEDFQMPSVHALLAEHSRIAPSLSPAFGVAIRRAMDEVLGLRMRPTSDSGTERTILRLRSTFPRYADEIIARAREYAQA